MSGMTVRAPATPISPTGVDSPAPVKTRGRRKQPVVVDDLVRTSGPVSGRGRTTRGNVVALRAKGKTKSGIDHAAVRALGAQVREVAPNVFLFTFADSERMALTFMRFQEHYESPRFAGQVFSREEFERWYASTHDGRFSYAEDWGGFNVPSRVFAPFAAGDFAPLTRDEQRLLDAVAGVPGTFYVIASASDEVVPHEVSHGLFATDPEYRREVLKVLGSIDVAPIIATLERMGYHTSSCIDEAHAYLRDGGGELANQGVDLAPYLEAIRELRRLFTNHRARAERALGRRDAA